MTITTNRAVHTGKLLRRACLGLAALGVSAAVLSAPAALADPADPAPAPTPAPVDAPTDAAAAPVSATPSPLADGVPHLPSPDNLPAGTTDAPPPPRSLGYLREVLHAIGNHDVSMSDALLLLAQRPMTATAGPGQSAAPSGPVGSSAAVPAVPAAPAATPTADPGTP